LWIKNGRKYNKKQQQFKLHIATNEKGELLSVKFTQGNVDDRRPAESLCKNLNGRLFGDKGYISKKLFSCDTLALW